MPTEPLTTVLACPTCAAPLDATPLGPGRAAAVLACDGCGRSSSVIDGIWDALTSTSRRPQRTAAQLTNTLGLVARGYEPVWRRRSLTLLSGRSFPNTEELAELSAAVTPRSGSVFVDVACSEGLYARHLAAAGASVVAVDHSTAFLRRLARHHVAGILPVRALAQHLPIREESADGAVIGGSLNEIGDLAAALREARRVTRAGGTLFSMSLVRATSSVGRGLQAAARPSGIVFPTKSATLDLMHSTGWRVTNTALDRVVLRVSATAV